ncbi:MAG: ABC transporter ATP-binding protein [Hyphomicrobiaceae bacterium]
MTLELRNIVKTVGPDTHIYDTSVALAPEGFNILLGTTLAGKTTLMQIMAGLEVPTSGEVWFNGVNVTGVPVQKRNVSMVYQQFINYPNLSVFENIASPLRVARLPRDEIKRRVEEMAELMKLTPMLYRRPSELSGGQQQRTAMARALVKDADLVLLDEPLANLDFKLREELRDEMPKLFANRNCTVVYATTEPSEALLLGGHTATLHNGRLTQFGPTARVYRQPADVRTAQVFSEPPINLATVTKQGGDIILSDSVRWQARGASANLKDATYTIGIRPHHVTPKSAATSPADITGSVLVTELSGSESVIHFAHGTQTWVSQSHGIHAIDVGAEAAFQLDIDRCIYFNADGTLIGEQP